MYLLINNSEGCLQCFYARPQSLLPQMRAPAYLRAYQQLRLVQGNPAMTIRTAVNFHFTQMLNMHTQTTPHRAKNPFLRGTAELKGCVQADPGKAESWSLVSMTKHAIQISRSQVQLHGEVPELFQQGELSRNSKAVCWQQNKFIKANGPERDCICPAVPWQEQK